MKLGRPPTATVLPIAMIGTSARPAGSSGKMLHQLCELAEAATPTFLLQRMSPFVAQGFRPSAPQFTEAIGRTPEKLSSP